MTGDDATQDQSALTATAFAGRVVAAHGRHYLVELADGERLDCFPRNKKSDIACGDEVDIERIACDQGVIVRILPRRSLLYRSDRMKQKLIAANVTQVVVVVATDPPYSDEVLMRCLIAADDQELESLIVLNKYDLEDRRSGPDARMALLEAARRRVLRLTAKRDASPLAEYLQGHTSLLVGQSGMGKSTLVNALLPDARCVTGEISRALNSGRHTTTHAELYRLGDNAALIDSPGLQEFGLAHVGSGVVESAFADLAPWFGQCQFRDCRHEREPNCALRTAVAQGAVAAQRLTLLLNILRSLPNRDRGSQRS